MQVLERGQQRLWRWCGHRLPFASSCGSSISCRREGTLPESKVAQEMTHRLASRDLPQRSRGPGVLSRDPG